MVADETGAGNCHIFVDESAACEYPPFRGRAALQRRVKLESMRALAPVIVF
jgi:hypothetical protein